MDSKCRAPDGSFIEARREQDDLDHWIKIQRVGMEQVTKI
jgi:hypothetical protein